MKNIQYFLFATLLIFSACRKDDIKTDFEFDPTDEGVEIITKLSGQVIDEAGLPLAGAMVRVANEEQTTNEDGVFSFSEKGLKEKGEMISIEKGGFFTNIKRVLPNVDNTFQRIGMVAKGAPTGTFPATQGGTISKPDGEKIVFQANSIIDESGNDYNGEVAVYTHHFNPEDLYLGEMMPGDLSGINDEGNRVQLASYSMILAELYGTSGQKLNLKSGTTAAVEFPIKGSAAANAPAEIPLWSLDELTGIWVEEGRAIRDGNYYKAEVTHFSFWNCDDDFDLINLEGQVLDQAGIPVTNTTISLEIVNGGMVRSNTTNSEGRFRGGVPVNEALILRLINQCGDIVHTENIGPFSGDDQVSITIDNTTGFLVLSGSLKNCNGEPVTRGYAVAVSDLGVSYYLPIDANGNFNSSLSVCQTNELSIFGVDDVDIHRSNEIVVSYTGQPTENVGDIETCENLDEFISMKYDGDRYLITTAADVILEPERLRIERATDASGSRTFSMRIDNPQFNVSAPPASVSLTNMFISLALRCSDFNGNTNYCTGNSTVKLTHFDDFIGGYVEGIVEGQLWNEIGTLNDVEIEFRLKIDFKLIKVGGRVWDDLNKDGIQDAGEPGIPNVDLSSTVYFNGPGNGAFSYGAITDADGNYTTLMTLDKLGSISIFEIQNGDYMITLQGQGDPATDSDFDPSTGKVENINVIEGADNIFDCGAYLK